ncbi:MAG TPA: pectinesterase family protein [Hyphomonadaceae bacterium]|nr:pectinesterase family protein [Hyphomonadaceae bacterium]
MYEMFRSSRRFAFIVALALPLAACVTGSAEITPSGGGPATLPENGAVNVNPDTHLVLTFASEPKVGTSGLVRIYDAADNSLVDTLDLSIPPSPNPNGRSSAATEAERRAQAAATKMEDFQVNTVGGVGFHFFPIIVRGNTATIYPHNNRLTYGRTYLVKADPGVLSVVGGEFAGAEWRFSTKASAPNANAARLVVSADGKGDFSTVQGAIDFLPEKPAQRVTIFVRSGRYEELVYISKKSNIIIRGEDRAKVEVTYPNNSAFNPPRAGGPSRRPAFSIQDGADIQLSNFTITNSFIGQAEALLVRGQRIIIDHMTLNGSGDALTTYGTIYMADSKLVGHGDTILGYAALFCLRCELQSVGPFTWTRTPEGSHGNVFVDSTFEYLDRPLPWTVTATDPGRKSPGVLARLPKNGPTGAPGANFPHAEMVLINARMKGVPAVGWGPVEEPPEFDSSKVRFWEYNTMAWDGRPIDMSQRHKVSKQLTLPKDADLIAQYRDPEFVLDGWKPVVE